MSLQSVARNMGIFIGIFSSGYFVSNFSILELIGVDIMTFLFYGGSLLINHYVFSLEKHEFKKK